MSEDTRETIIQRFEAALVQMRECSRYTPEDVDELESAAWDVFPLLKAQDAGWISVKDAMPPERETIFAKFKGTAQWNPAMFATGSEDVRVVVQFEDGTRKVWHDNTMDGKWKCEREKCAYPKRTVTHWMPNPDLPKEG